MLRTCFVAGLDCRRVPSQVSWKMLEEAASNSQSPPPATKDWYMENNHGFPSGKGWIYFHGAFSISIIIYIVAYLLEPNVPSSFLLAFSCGAGVAISWLLLPGFTSSWGLGESGTSGTQQGVIASGCLATDHVSNMIPSFSRHCSFLLNWTKTRLVICDHHCVHYNGTVNP